MKNEKGFALIETLIAMVIMSTVAVALLSGLFTTAKATFIADEQVAVESLAKSQLEYVNFQDYITVADYDAGDPEKRYAPINIPSNLVEAGYVIEINPPQTITIPSEGDFELQSITVVIKRNGEEIFTISDYKAGR